MAFSRTVKDSILAWFKGTTFTAAPSTVYVALLTTQPTDDTGTGLVEVSTGTWTNYTRQATGTMSSPAGTGGTRSISNNAAVDYGTSSMSGSVTVTGIAFYDSATIGSGTLLGFATLTGGNQTVVNNTDVQFAAGQLVISEA